MWWVFLQMPSCHLLEAGMQRLRIKVFALPVTDTSLISANAVSSSLPHPQHWQISNPGCLWFAVVVPELTQHYCTQAISQPHGLTLNHNQWLLALWVPIGMLLFPQKKNLVSGFHFRWILYLSIGVTMYIFSGAWDENQDTKVGAHW